MLNKLFGIKLRSEYYENLLFDKCAVDWIEILTENYLSPSSYDQHYLKLMAERYPIAMHGVSMSLGGCDDLDYTYLQAVKQLASALNPLIISDHVCVTKINGVYTHDLLPLPYTEESINNIVDRIKFVQDFLGRQIAIENVSSYFSYPYSQMSEIEFINAICQQADCLLLLDINNVYVSAINHGFSAKDYISRVPLERVVELHIAGHSNNGGILIDTHDQIVCDAVWDLYDYLCQIKRNIPLVLERDANLPVFSELIRELDIARKING